MRHICKSTVPKSLDDFKEQKHIDHYVKRDIDHNLTFSWTNMIAAVKDYRFGADWKDDHIKKSDYDSSKKRYKNILDPVVDDFTCRFKFYTDGFMEPSDCNDILAENTITMFKDQIILLCF